MTRPTFESTAAFDIDYDRFTESDSLRSDVTRRLAGAFGDDDARNLAVTRLERGSVVIGWTNASLTDIGQCPADELRRIKTIMFDENGQV